VIEHHGLDAKEGFTLEVTGFAANDAADVALMGEAVDGIVEDWLWVSRLRGEGVPLTFIPYSSSVGALMVPADGSIDSLADLDGKRLGIAGGPLDKSWLLIQALAKEQGVDLAEVSEPVYGAPPLLTEKFRSGELDAVINYWHFAARLEAEGHRRLIDVTQAQEALGVPADTPQLGYVLREEWADAQAELVQAFARASRAAKTIMDQSDEEWERLRPLTRAEDDATLEALKRRYREGSVRSWGERERQAARKLYGVLAELGGEQLVGNSPVLVDGTFWSGVSY
jgi:NitT/TauT family transport system substrate-binding protein